MNRRREAQKQKLSLKNFHRLARSSLSPSIHEVRRSLLRPRTLLLGLTATISISTVALAIQNDAHVKSQSIKATVQSSSTSPGTNNTGVVDVTVDNTPDPETTDQGTGNSADTTTQVTINNQPVPTENGEVHQTFSDNNGSVFSVDISVDSHSTNSDSSHSSTSIDIDADSSSTDNSTRGSPRR